MKIRKKQKRKEITELNENQNNKNNEEIKLEEDNKGNNSQDRQKRLEEKKKKLEEKKMKLRKYILFKQNYKNYLLVHITKSSYSGKRNFKVYPYPQLNDSILKGYESLSEKYKNIVGSCCPELQWGVTGV